MFDLPEPGSVTVKVFDLMGREVAVLVNGERPAGQHTIRFDARDLPSGMYICRMTANEFTASHKMMLIR
ncbi:MAG: T9SS type A sorting domain-containing protein [bacterium]|nr:T9SS type A sorting domain-containing protein [bacterium]